MAFSMEQNAIDKITKLLLNDIIQDEITYFLLVKHSTEVTTMTTNINKQPPGLVLGTNEFNTAIDMPSTKQIVERFLQHHKNRDVYIDTSIVYAQGKSEESLASYSNNPNILISTKVSPSKFGGLTKASIKKQCYLSLKKMKRNSVDILYIHNPTNKVPILQQLQAINELYLENKFKRFGICHYSSWEVTEIVYLCDKYNLIKPTVYQGRYNIFRREIESELMPCLRHFNISFYGFSPTARGILAGNHKFIDKQNNTIQNGKFTTQWSPINFEDYWYKSFFNVRDQIQNVCNTQNISLLEVNFSWLLYHSILDGSKGDKIILGGSKYIHFDQNLKAVSNSKPLNNELIEVIENGWKITRAEGLQYHRNFEQIIQLFVNAKKWEISKL